MGNHYIPRFYLRGFEKNGHIFAHSKEKKRSFRTKVGQVAHSNGYYSEDLEKYLTENIEQPANPVLENLRAGRPIEPRQRLALARYIFVLWKRVPKARKRVMDNLPNVVGNLQKEADQEFDHLEQDHPGLRGPIQKVRDITRETIQKQLNAPHPSIWDSSIREGGEVAIESLLSMNWVFYTQSKLQFLTSDNPVFTFSSLGTNRPESELSLPLSPSLMFWATRAKVKDNVFLAASNSIAKEFNRRTAHHADRFVFSQNLENWIVPFISRTGWDLNRIQL